MYLSKITHLLKQKYTVILVVLVCIDLVISMSFNLKCAKHHDSDQAMKTWAADMIFIKHLNDSKNYYDGFQKIISVSNRDKAVYRKGSPAYISRVVDTWNTTQEIARKVILPTMTGKYRSLAISDLHDLVILQNKFYKEDPSEIDYKMYDASIDGIIFAINYKVMNDEMRLLNLPLVE